MHGLVVLISGKGSNLAALCRAGLADQIQCVISNKKDALGLEVAKQYSIPTQVISHKDYTTRESFDQALMAIINSYAPRLIALAGFMRILTADFVNYYTNKMVNIHPSLLPSFVGADAQSYALNAQVKVSGATVHYVTTELDHGPIIAQGVVAVENGDNREQLAARILELEHVLYPFVIKKILDNRVKILDNSQVITNKAADDIKALGKYHNHVYY